METVAGGLPLPIPEGPYFDVLSRLSIKDLHRYTCLSGWRDVFINFPDSRKNLPQTLQGFFYLGCDCRSHSPGGDDRDSGAEGDGAHGNDCSGNSSGGGDRDEDEDDSGSRDCRSSYGDDVGNRDDGGGDDEVGRGRDSACSGNFVFRFLDLLAKSMPVPDDTDTELSFIPSSAHVDSSRIDLLCSCNGLILFGCAEGSESYHSQGYIVCNPATKQWRTVPSSGWVLPDDEHLDEEFESTFLFFDPAVPSRFLLIQFWHDEDATLDLIGENGGVQIYSSETGEWSDRSSEWMQFAREGEWGDEYGVHINSGLGSSFLNGMLHFFVRRRTHHDVLIVAVDGEGCICRIMHWPLDEYTKPVFIGQSQGRLHCISADFRHECRDQRYRIIMYVSVLEDYDAEQRRLGVIRKLGIWGCHLSGGEECRREDYEVVAFHPDGNLIYFVDRRKGRLIQYDISGNYGEDEQVLRLCTHIHSFRDVTPYVPCFSRSSALHDEASENPV